MTGGGPRRRRSWEPLPPSQSAHLDTRPSLTLGPTGETSGWSDNLSAHVVLLKPPCNARPNKIDVCGELAMLWRRCGFCKEVFARCSDHVSQDGHELREAFDKHAHWQGEGSK